MAKNTNKIKIIDMTLIAVFAVLIAICSWISIPAVIPFTLQTFGVFFALGVLGGKRGTVSILIYVLLGLVGVPVFSGFKSGAAALFGPTGGYILGFILCALIYWLITHFFSEKTVAQLVSFVAGLIFCYAFGTVWFVYVYSAKVEPIGFAAALSMCVIPFIIPDLIKIGLAMLVIRIIKPLLKKAEKQN